MYIITTCYVDELFLMVQKHINYCNAISYSITDACIIFVQDLLYVRVCA